MYKVHVCGARGGGEKIRVRGQIGEIIQGFTPIFRVLAHFLMVSVSTSSKQLKNAIKSLDLPLLRALEAQLSFKVGEESRVNISEVGKKIGVP